MRVDVDETTLRLLDMLHDHRGKEPAEPDWERVSTPDELALVARRRHEWERQLDALRILVSVRLLEAALDQYPDVV